jgi:hypothetical protein
MQDCIEGRRLPEPKYHICNMSVIPWPTAQRLPEEEGIETKASLSPEHLSSETWIAVPSFVLSPWFIIALISCTPKAEDGIAIAELVLHVFDEPYRML